MCVERCCAAERDLLGRLRDCGTHYHGVASSLTHSSLRTSSLRLDSLAPLSCYISLGLVVSLFLIHLLLLTGSCSWHTCSHEPRMPVSCSMLLLVYPVPTFYRELQPSIDFSRVSNARFMFRTQKFNYIGIPMFHVYHGLLTARFNLA